jgi:polysaccharide biosynthesis/export protein
MSSTSVRLSPLCSGLSLRFENSSGRRISLMVQAAFVCFSVVTMSACATRGYTRSHAQVVGEAKSKGVAVRAVEEERKIFDRYQKENRNKLYSLLRERGGSAPASDGSAALVGDGNYVLGPSDIIELAVFGVDELNTKARITQTGMVSLPLLGAVELGGLTEEDATNRLKKELSVHLRNPEVVLSIAEYGSHEVSVIGSVANPGKLALRKDRNTLLEVIGGAGGLTKEAGNFLTIIPATEKGSAESLVAGAKHSLELSSDTGSYNNGIELPVAAALGLNNAPPVEVPLRGGDIVIVQPAGQVLVEGEVENRGAYTLGDNSTLVGALASAGGLTYSARFDEIEIIRKIGNADKVTIVYNLEKIQSGEEDNPLLKNGDIVRIPSAEGKRFSQDVFKAIQNFINIGGAIPL